MPSTPIDRWNQWMQQELDKVCEAGQMRSLQSRTLPLDFASNDYLSLNSDGTLPGILRDVMLSWESNVGSTGSRLLRGHHEAFDHAEEDFCVFAKSPASLLFHSGYAANVGVLQTILSSRDTVFCDRLCHATILDGIRISGATRHYFKHNDLNDLEAMIQKRPLRGQGWIITESIFSMDGDSPDLMSIVEIAERYGLLVYLDEAHSIGVVGESGNGLACDASVEDRIALRVFPCGKAPGLMGAFVCGSANLRNLLINRCRSFIFSTAQPPFLAEALRRVIARIVQMKEAREHLVRTSVAFIQALRDAGFDPGSTSSHIVPVMLGEEARALIWMNRLSEAGIDARAIRPPSVPAGSSRLRINLHAGHSTADVDALVKELYTAKQIEAQSR